MAHFGGEFLFRKRLVDCFHRIAHLRDGLLQLFAAAVVDVGDPVVHPATLEQVDRRLEDNEFAELGHVDAIAVGIADLRSSRGDDDLLRIQPREDLDDRVLQGGSADDRIVDHDEILAFADLPVGDIVDVRDHLVASLFLGDKGAQLDVLVRDLFATRPALEDELVKSGLVEFARSGGSEDFILHLVSPQHAQAVHQTVVGDLGSVRDEAENGLVEIGIDPGDDLRHEVGPQSHPFAVDVGIVAPREIDALEGAGTRFTRFGVGRDFETAAMFHHRDVGTGQLTHFVDLGIENRHEGDALAREGDHFVVLVIKAGANPVRIPQHEAVPVADDAGDGVAAVPDLRALADDADEVDLLGNDSGDFSPLGPLVALAAVDRIVHLVEVIADLLEHGLGVGVEDRMLAATNQVVIEVAGIRHVEVARHHEGLRWIIRATHVRMASPAAEGA